MPASKFCMTIAMIGLWLAASSLRAETVLVKANSLSLREKPNTSAKRLQRLPTHTPVEVKVRKGDWTQIRTSTGKTGWVLSRYLSPTAFVSVDVTKVKANQLNVRRGPGTNYSVIMRVSDHYPYLVLDRASGGTRGWLKVMDFDGDQGWISANLVTFVPYVITQLDRSNIRSGPDQERASVAFTAERGVLLKVLEEKRGWLRVRHDDGDTGWVSAKIVFGWFDGSRPHAGRPKRR